VTRTITINRAPVLTLWAAVVAERIGFARDEALTLGRAVAGMNAAAKAARLGITEPASEGEKAKRRPLKGAEHVELLGRSVPVLHTPQGLRAAKDGKPDSSSSVARYLEQRFGDDLEPARDAMTDLARSLPPRELAALAYSLYEDFRPSIPAGVRGWGAKGVLDLGKLKKLTVVKKKR
jgi:hypothetical protein